MDGLLPIALSLVFLVHAAVFGALGVRRRRRGESGARQAILAVAFLLMTLAQVGEYAVAREVSFASAQALTVVTWLARGLFALGLGILVYGLVRRLRQRRSRPRG